MLLGISEETWKVAISVGGSVSLALIGALGYFKRKKSSATELAVARKIRTEADAITLKIREEPLNQMKQGYHKMFVAQQDMIEMQAKQIAALYDRCRKLEKEIQDLRADNVRLWEENQKHAVVNAALTQEVSELKDLIATKEK